MKKTLLLTLTFLLVLSLAMPAAAAPPVDEPPAFLRARDGDPAFPRPVEVRFDPDAVPAVFKPPVEESLRPQAATIVVDFLAAGATNAFGRTCMAFPAAAQTSMQAAADAWEPMINSTVTMRIEACWADLDTGILGSSGALGYWRDFTNRPVAGTFYPVALANALSGSDLDPASNCTGGTPVTRCNDMGIMYNNDYISSFYYGTDGNPGGLTDFMSVVMHEIAHALGFAGSMSVSGGLGYWGLGSGTYYPIAYDRFTYDNDGAALIGYTRGTAALATALTTPTMTYRGAETVKAYCGSNAPLYTPSTWRGGSSYSHFSDLMDTYDRAQNAMMTYSIGGGQVFHHPGAMALGLLRDVGWNIPGALNVPTGPAAAPASPTSIQITWSDTNTSPNESGYVLERSTTGSDPWTVVATTAANATSYADTVDSVSNPYYYRVRAANGGALYCPSSVVYLIPSAVLNAPMGLTAAALTPNRVRLSWNEANLYADGYQVERSENGPDGPWALLGTAAPFSLGFTDDTAREGTRYDYRVTAFALEPAGESPPAAAQALTPLLAPVGLSAARAPGSAVTLTWTDASALETGYTAERSLDGKTGWQPACSAATDARSCTAPTAPAIWYFRVRAERSADPANASAWSALVRLAAADHFIFAPLVTQ